jgi:hypothetical protein
MENKQTERIADASKTMSSIDWLGLELSKIGFFPSGIPDKIYEQAKEKHKQETINAYKKGFLSDDIKLADDYYKQNYEK